MIFNTNNEIRSTVKILQWFQDMGENNLRKLRSIKRETGKINRADWNLLYHNWVTSVTQYFEDNKLLENQTWRINNLFYIATAFLSITPWAYCTKIWNLKNRISTIKKLKDRINKLESPKTLRGPLAIILAWINNNVLNQIVATMLFF